MYTLTLGVQLLCTMQEKIGNRILQIHQEKPLQR